MINCKICETYCCWFAGEDRTVEECPDRTPATNADRIRSMTDEDLAVVMEKGILCGHNVDRCGKYWRCYDCILAWLKEEVTDV